MKKHIDNMICCGCGACDDICSRGAIKMGFNELQEEVAFVNEHKCVECIQCMQVCPQITIPCHEESKEAYTGFRTDDAKRKYSSSGGIATLVSEEIIKKGGYVCGVKMSEKIIAEYMMTSDIKDLDMFKGSKYVQAKINDVFNKVKIKLQEGKWVLFIGVPCQVAALVNFLNIKKCSTDRLYLIDLICHGVCTSNYLQDEVNYLKNKYYLDGELVVCFRNNIEGEDYNFAIKKKNIIQKKWSCERSYYFWGFLRGITLRQSCMRCNYDKKQRVGDLTIGDYDKDGIIEYKYPKVKNFSIILVNTRNGRKLLNMIKEDVVLERIIDTNFKKDGLGGKKRIIDKKRMKFEKSIGNGKTYSNAIRRTIKDEIFLNTCQRVYCFIKNIIQKGEQK